MKKLINDPKEIVNELIDGYVLSQSNIVKKIEG